MRNLMPFVLIMLAVLVVTCNSNAQSTQTPQLETKDDSGERFDLAHDRALNADGAEIGVRTCLTKQVRT